MTIKSVINTFDPLSLNMISTSSISPNCPNIALKSGSRNLNGIFDTCNLFGTIEFELDEDDCCDWVEASASTLTHIGCTSLFSISLVDVFIAVEFTVAFDCAFVFEKNELGDGIFNVAVVAFGEFDKDGLAEDDDDYLKSK